MSIAIAAGLSRLPLGVRFASWMLLREEISALVTGVHGRLVLRAGGWNAGNLSSMFRVLLAGRLQTHHESKTSPRTT
jgi:hypothetical protein